MPYTRIPRAELVIESAAWLSQVRGGDNSPPKDQIRRAWRDLTSLEFEAVYRDAYSHANLLENGGLVNVL